MGAEFISETVKCKKSELKGIFQEMVDQAYYDHGHSGYTGSWAETSGIKPITSQVFLNDDAAYEWVIDTAQKWEEALAVPLNEDGNHWFIGAWASC